MKTEVSHPFFVTAFFLLACVAVVHTQAISHFLYWKFPWLDIVVHFFAGVVVALFTLWTILRFAGVNHVLWTRFSLYVVLASIIVVGTIWELFEHAVGISRGVNFKFDTSLDFLMDILGSVSATYIVRKWH
jgi:hypothetical protein